MKKKTGIAGRFLLWRLRYLSDKQFIIILSILIGIITGLVAVIIKNSTHYIRIFVEETINRNELTVIYILSPVLGVTLAILFAKYLLKKTINPGIPNVLYAISKNKGKIPTHNMFSSIIGSSITVGFGGSAGLEGPTVTTCAAWGSFLGRITNLDYKQNILLLACASAATISAIFKAPIAAIVFALEVVMLDLTMWSLLPLLMSTMASILTSYFFVGQDLLYPFEVTHRFELNDIVWYIGLGIFCGLISSYFTQIYLYFESKFKNIKSLLRRLALGGILLGGLIFLFPALYGEGYEDINSCLTGDYSYLFHDSIFAFWEGHKYSVIIMLFAILMTKALATSITINAGGIGGIFAPSLYIGVSAGAFFAVAINTLGITHLHIDNFSLIGMGGMIAGILHAPLTGIFLIADISGGYHLFVPLMLTATISYITVKAFVPHSVYTIQLAKRKELMTHNKDKVVISLMKVDKLLERDFTVVKPDDSLGLLVESISNSHRNIFPVTDNDNNFLGIVKLDTVRKVMFKPELYDSMYVKDFIEKPEYIIDINEDMFEVVNKFQNSDKYNLAVLEDGQYLGFVSRAKIFSKYRLLLKYFSED